MTKFTPKMLRQIADKLNADTHGPRTNEFICIIADNEFGFEASFDIQILLAECGLTRLGGGLGMQQLSPAPSEYELTAMPVRFMFLEFMALYLEDKVTAKRKR